MKTIVLLKQVPDTAAQIMIAKDGKDIDKTSLSCIINPYDEYALEEALRIKEKTNGSVTVISAGPEKVKDALRSALALGVDSVVHIKDDAIEGSDSLGIATLLAAACKTMEYDIILCGKQAVDDDCALVGPMVAELLGLPHASLIVKLGLSADSKTALAHREVEGGAEVVELTLPALVTAQKGLNEPRYASLSGIMQAKKKPIQELNVQALGIDASRVGKTGAKLEAISLAYPKERTAGKLLEGEIAAQAKEAARLLREEAKVI